MNGKRIGYILIALFLSLMISACGTSQVGLESPDTAVDSDPQEQVAPPVVSETEDPAVTQEDDPVPSGTIRQEFTELGISLDVPADLYVKKEPLVNYDDQATLDSYLFYIQNYGYPGGPPSGDFQMYGHLQYNLPPITGEQFAEIQADSQGMYEYITPIEINGLKGFDSQFAGQRNRYVYMFLLEGHILNIAVSDPTPENKAISDEIISTLQYDSEGFTDASNMRLVSDPNQLFQVLLPDDWAYGFHSTVGTQLSSLEASSPDMEVVIDDEVEGPHSNIYYKKGITLHIQVIDDDSLQFNPGWPDQQEYDVYFNGILGTVYVFKEPSTVEGEITSVAVAYEGRTYLLRFGYAEDANLDTIDQIISNFEITPENFYPTP